MAKTQSINADRKDFFQKVYELTRLIPKGRVTSYGAIAKALGMAKSSRMVGWALIGSASHDVPAHRVVNRNGVLTGKVHFNPPEKMAELLANEGVEVVDDKVVHFKELFWNPLTDLEI